MKSHLFAALLLGCFLIYVHSQTGEFEFYDNNGVCWRCTPGSACERCSNRNTPVIPRNVDWPTTCETPDCEALRLQGFPLSQIIPSVESRNYYVCRPDPANPDRWVAEERTCPCEKFFSYIHQRCDYGFLWEPHCRNMNPVEVERCPGTDGGSPGPETNTTTTAVPDPDTTPSPCVCVPWWPCWCNPCWNMPCHSCSGCAMG